MKKSNYFLLIVFFCISSQLFAQSYDDYIGAGHSRDIIVTSSHDLQKDGWSQTASADKTINGDGLEGKLSEAARFLSQATLCHDLQEIEWVAEIGLEAWIDSQAVSPMVLYLPMLDSVLQDYYSYLVSISDTIPPFPFAYKHFQKTAYWRMNLTERDFLRDKITAAWLEIFVVSIVSDLNPYGASIMDYQDIFKRNAFGNFRDILEEITLHPAMGTFLNHYANAKADTVANTLADENFAREVMQLFTIGLIELNNDGTPVFNTNVCSMSDYPNGIIPDSCFIPTYNNQDIGEMAKVFTGLGAGATIFSTINAAFNTPIWARDYTVPMIMYPDKHETSAKSIFDGDLIIPANQAGMEDIDMVLDYLFNHPNLPPFICQRLIQLFVKSNPTPAYVNRVVNTFIDDGYGVRGNMKAVFKSILLDEEARSCDWQMHPEQGKLKPATEKTFQFARAIGLESESGKIWTDAAYQSWTAGHLPMTAPSVFNHHQRDYRPFGEIGDAGLVAPEFQIFNTQTSIGYMNLIWQQVFIEYGHGNWRDDSWKSHINFDNFLEASQDAEVLINMLDLRLTNGNMTPYTRDKIKTAITSLDPDSAIFPYPPNLLEDYETEFIKLAITLILMSPDFNIIK